MRKRLLAFLLSLCMIFSLLPVTAFAAGDISNTKYDNILIYLDSATQEDFDELGAVGKVRIRSDKYAIGYRDCSQVTGGWWTENSRGVTANDIKNISLMAGGSSIDIPITGDKTYSVTLTGVDDYTPAVSYTHLTLPTIA